MERGEQPSVIKLPYSGAEIRFTEDYSRENLLELTRRLIVDEELATKMRRSPTEELEKLGIVISEEDRRRVTDEDMLVAMGHRPPRMKEGEVEPEAFGPAAVVLVIVGVINFPGPAY